MRSKKYDTAIDIDSACESILNYSAREIGEICCIARRAQVAGEIEIAEMLYATTVAAEATAEIAADQIVLVEDPYAALVAYDDASAVMNKVSKALTHIAYLHYI